MVVSGHQLASDIGAEVLEQGGNAIDSAVAVGFAIAVVLPRAGNIGGGGFLVYRDANGEVFSLDYRETAPAASHRDMYLDEDGEPTDASITGHLAAGVPGSVAGLFLMHERFGKLEWSAVVAPAIELARGHVLDQTRHDDIARSAERLSSFPASRDQFLPEGEAPPVGEVFAQPDLAKTLERIARSGPAGFYEGETADLIVAEMARGGGIMTAADLKGYKAIWRDPVELAYRGYKIFTMPPPSSGGVALALMLNQLERWEEMPRFGSAKLLQLEAEVMRRAFIDRNRYLADPDFVEMPLERLVSQEYADTLASGILEGKATPTLEFELEPEAPYGAKESTETTHYSVVAPDGGAASITTTLNGSFGSAVTVAGAGFLLNNEMDDFAAAPGKPNMYGLVQGEANAIEPGKRMLSSMTPSIVLDPAGELDMVVGTPGGPTIITTVYHVMSNVIDQGMTLEEAVGAPRVHHQALPDRLFFEPSGLHASTRACA